MTVFVSCSGINKEIEARSIEVYTTNSIFYDSLYSVNMRLFKKALNENPNKVSPYFNKANSVNDRADSVLQQIRQFENEKSLTLERKQELIDMVEEFNIFSFNHFTEREQKYFLWPSYENISLEWDNTLFLTILQNKVKDLRNMVIFYFYSHVDGTSCGNVSIITANVLTQKKIYSQYDSVKMFFFISESFWNGGFIRTNLKFNSQEIAHDTLFLEDYTQDHNFKYKFIPSQKGVYELEWAWILRQPDGSYKTVEKDIESFLIE
ncbi:MAG: hypothetical protein M3Q58_09815 [Bacteroidota bacterium]|nr:hypothetical protein [Bacteroidota bacterium]